MPWPQRGASRQVLATLEAFNASVESEPGRLRPPRSRNRYPLVRPPFFAVLVRPGIAFTSGGLQVDTQMRVLRRTSSITALPLVAAPVKDLVADAVPGLYVAGCDVGGFSTDAYMVSTADAYMGGLACALVTGRIAADSAVDFARLRERAGSKVETDSATSEPVPGTAAPGQCS